MTEPRKSRVLSGELAGAVLGPGLVVLPGQGNSLAIETDAGVVVLDASSPNHADGMIAALRDHTDARVHAIVYSHGHHGYNSAVDVWQRHNAERGDPAPRLVGHRNVLERYARYRETDGLQQRMGAIQFPGRDVVTLEQRSFGMRMFDPTEVFDDRMLVVDGARRVEVVWAPSETHDSIAVWLPDDGLLCAGPAVPGNTIPNIGTPLRTQRFTIRWAESLERLADLGASRMMTEFGPMVEGSDTVDHQLRAAATALRWLRDEVVRRMNHGMHIDEILADIDYPAEMFDQPWMTPTYGAPEYIVRDLFREENGWWDRNPTTLHPAPTGQVTDTLRSLVDDGTVLARTRQLADAGDTQLALHVVDLLALCEGDDPAVVEARALKAELCITRSREVEPYVSRGCYRSGARLLRGGDISWTSIE